MRGKEKNADEQLLTQSRFIEERWEHVSSLGHTAQVDLMLCLLLFTLSKPALWLRLLMDSDGQMTPMCRGKRWNILRRLIALLNQKRWPH